MHLASISRNYSNFTILHKSSVMKQHDNSIIIIGARFAGLAAGIYGRMNGYNTRIFEMHNKPGGLCASWKRNGYTFDGCIHSVSYTHLRAHETDSYLVC